METEEIKTLSELVTFLEQGINLGREHEDKAFVGLVKSIQCYAKGEVLSADPEKAFRALLGRKDNYPERDKYLEMLDSVITESPYCSGVFPDRAIAIIHLGIALFRGEHNSNEQGILRFTRPALRTELQEKNH